MKFLSRLIVEKYTAPGEFVLYRDFLVDVMVDGLPFRVAIPRGFLTDFASVPKLVQLLPGFDVNGRSAQAAVVHDFAYCCNGELPLRDLVSGDIVQRRLTRERCDGLLYDGLIASGYSNAVASTFYAGVRAGGWLHWKKRKDGLVDSYDFVPESYWENRE